MTRYCDRLTLRLALSLVVERLAGRCARGTRLAILDGPVSGLSAGLAAAVLRAAGIDAAEAPFFAGHLRAPTGEGVPVAARKAAFLLADRGSRLLLERSALLREVNARWGRETVRLWLARQQWLPAERVMLRAFAVEAVGDPAGTSPILYLAWPAALPLELLADLPTRVRIHVSGRVRPGWKSGRFSAILWALRDAFRKGRASGAPLPASAPPPTLLVPQEDDLSRDRSYRVQPHWLGDEAPSFRTLVLRLGTLFDVDLSPEDRRRAAIEVVDLRQASASGAKTQVAADLRRQFSRLLLSGLFAARAVDSLAANEAARLVITAAGLAGFCVAQNVRAFLTCENYLLHADAMQLIASPLGIRTVSYQYSNMPTPSLPMQTTADRFVAFSPAFDARFSWPGLRTPAFVHAGYVYDSAFARVASRAAERRARLQAAGAEFIVGFFDESVQRDKYGLVNGEDHASDLMTLLRLLEADPTIGLVFKTQFHHNLQALSPPLRNALDRALATGRLEMPSKGKHRNTVLPAEVAKTADVTVGHAFGGTASLECALAGCRSVMVNAWGLETNADPLYTQVDIMCASMDEVCEALQAFRRGERPTFGDWEPILGHFDPFRDGRSDRRLFAILEEAVCH